MIVNGALLNAVALNEGESSALPATGVTVLTLNQVIAYPTGSTVLALRQNIRSSGTTTLSIQQNIFDESSVSYAAWDVVVKVDGVDLGDALVNSAEMDAELNAARLAVFTVKLSGSVNADDWTGKDVTIDWVQSNGATWRRFTGVIVKPQINLTDMTMTCQCSDDLQRIADMHSNEELLTLSGGRWSKYVFAEDAAGWRYLQDVLTTVPVAVQRNSLGHLQAVSWQCAAVPDYTFTADDILNDTPQLTLAERSSLINRVDIEFDARFERLYHREVRMQWVHNVNFCGSYANPIIYPTRSMVRDAINDSGWTLLAESYAELWPTGTYFCGGSPIAWTNVDNELVRQFNIRAAFRWQQKVTNSFKIIVKDQSSINAYSELPTSLRSGIDFVSDAVDWDKDQNAGAALPSGFAVDDAHNKYRDDYSADTLDNALRTVIDVAIEKIAASHRSALPTLELALRPYLELGDTVQINDDMTCKGIISRIRERYNFDTGEAVSLIEITLSAGKSGLERLTNSYSVPEWPMQSSASESPDGIIDIVSHIGGGASSPLFDESWTGVITNYDLYDGIHIVDPESQENAEEIIIAGPPQEVPENLYPVQVRLAFDAIPDSKTQNRVDVIPVEILIQTPQNPITITA